MPWRRYNLYLAILSFGMLSALGGFNILVDPFLYRRPPVFELNQERSNFRKNYHLWNILAFRDKAAQVVHFGDSRTENLDVEVLEELTGETQFNFAFGGGSFQEMLTAFWFGLEYHRPQRVVFGMNFDMFNENNARNRFATPQKITTNAFTYYTNLYVARRSVATLANHWRNTYPTEAPPMDRETFWQYQLDVSTERILMNYHYPDRLLAQLKDVAAYCGEHGIEFMFIVPPLHRDYHAKIAELEMEATYVRFKAELAAIAPTIDFDYDHPLNRDAEAYKDPYHPDRELAEQVLKALAEYEKGEPLSFGKLLEPAS